MNIPRFLKIRQNFVDDEIKNIEDVVRDQIYNLGCSLKENSNIAIAVGSRGINNIARIVKETVRCIKRMNCNPFIVPAMGSHGGATAKGQKDILKSYGITEKYIEAPIFSTMDVIEISKSDLPFHLYMDRFAYNADGIIVINRIKAHTDFHGIIESGLLKMCVIGLGNRKQAVEMHSFGVYGLKEFIPLAARAILESGKIIMGIGIVENAYNKTLLVKALKPEEMEKEEIKLLEISKQHMPHLPIDILDLLIIDEMGKEISGVGIDTNVIGRLGIYGEPEPNKPKIKNIIVTDLTDLSLGNALGMGLADFITKKFYSKIDFKVTYKNLITSTFFKRGKMPIVAINSREAIKNALRACGTLNLSEPKIIRIKNTLNLSEMYVSRAVFDEIKDKLNIEVLGSFKNIITKNGDLTEF